MHTHTHVNQDIISKHKKTLIKARQFEDQNVFFCSPEHSCQKCVFQHIHKNFLLTIVSGLRNYVYWQTVDEGVRSNVAGLSGRMGSTGLAGAAKSRFFEILQEPSPQTAATLSTVVVTFLQVERKKKVAAVELLLC